MILIMAPGRKRWYEMNDARAGRAPGRLAQRRTSRQRSRRTFKLRTEEKSAQAQVQAWMRYGRPEDDTNTGHQQKDTATDEVAASDHPSDRHITRGRTSSACGRPAPPRTIPDGANRGAPSRMILIMAPGRKRWYEMNNARAGRAPARVAQRRSSLQRSRRTFKLPTEEKSKLQTEGKSAQAQVQAWVIYGRPGDAPDSGYQQKDASGNQVAASDHPSDHHSCSPLLTRSTSHEGGRRRLTPCFEKPVQREADEVGLQTAGPSPADSAATRSPAQFPEPLAPGKSQGTSESLSSKDFEVQTTAAITLTRIAAPPATATPATAAVRHDPHPSPWAALQGGEPNGERGEHVE
jgi:hypothetical protein